MFGVGPELAKLGRNSAKSGRNSARTRPDSTQTGTWNRPSPNLAYFGAGFGRFRAELAHSPANLIRFHVQFGRFRANFDQSLAWPNSGNMLAKGGRNRPKSAESIPNFAEIRNIWSKGQIQTQTRSHPAQTWPRSANVVHDRAKFSRNLGFGRPARQHRKRESSRHRWLMIPLTPSQPETRSQERHATRQI